VKGTIVPRLNLGFFKANSLCLSLSTFKGVDPSELSLANLSLKRTPARTPCGDLSNTSKYLILQLCAPSTTTVPFFSTLFDKFKASNSLHTPCTAFVLHLHFCWNENNSISLEISEIKLITLFNALLVGTSLTQEEKQLKLILFLPLTSNIQHEIIHTHSIKENA
jgi:hypothetical protein